MKTVMIIVALCLAFVLMSGLTPPGRKPVFVLGTLTPIASGPPHPAAGSPRKGSGAGQARWLRVVPGLFR